MTSLRTRIIRLAHAHPEFRDDLLPLIREAAFNPYSESSLSPQQRDFIHDIYAAANDVLKQNDAKANPGKISVNAKTQMPGKTWVKDGFGRKSPLAGKPHALVSFPAPTILVNGDEERSNSPLKILISEDGDIGIVELEIYGRRTVQTVSAKRAGELWAEAIVGDIGSVKKQKSNQQRLREIIDSFPTPPTDKEIERAVRQVLPDARCVDLRNTMLPGVVGTGDSGTAYKVWMFQRMDLMYEPHINWNVRSSSDGGGFTNKVAEGYFEIQDTTEKNLAMFVAKIKPHLR